MAGTHTLSHENVSRKSPINKSGVLTIYGFGVRLRVPRKGLQVAHCGYRRPPVRT